LAYSVIATVAKMVARAPVSVARELWEPVLTLGAAGHYAVGHFISCWFLEAFRIDANVFGERWREMIDYALGAPEWSGGEPWYQGQRLLLRILGCGSESILDKNSAFQSIVQQMSEYYERWARESLARDDDNIAAFCGFLSSSTGRSLRVAALRWLQEVLVSEAHQTWYRERLGNSLIEFLNVVLTQDVAAITNNPTARDAFLALVALLVAKQVPAALALQERARRAF
jgi:hypothetical protein